MVGLLKPSQHGYIYACSMIDRATNWIEVILMQNMTAEAIAKVFFEEWIARFGVPLQLTSDRGYSQFTSNLFDELTKLLGDSPHQNYCLPSQS
jgi:cleavage and polyadenylation specificity factor subunit 1